MQILDILTAPKGSAAVANLARSFNIEPKVAEAALTAIVPELTRAMEKNTLSRGGLADLVGMMGAPGRERYLEINLPLSSDEIRADGITILEQILGSKNHSRKVAERASRETGLSEDVLKQLLPAVAAVAIGALSKGAGGALGDLLAKLPALQGSPLPLPGEGPRTSSGPGSGGGGGGHPELPSRVPTGGTRIPRQSPLPIPGDDLPGLGRGRSQGGGLDDLSDVLRRGGRGLPVPQGGGTGAGTLWSIIRSILGGVLGFESKGFLGWLVRLIVLRWGWGFVKRVLSRVFVGR